MHWFNPAFGGEPPAVQYPGNRDLVIGGPGTAAATAALNHQQKKRLAP